MAKITSWRRKHIETCRGNDSITVYVKWCAFVGKIKWRVRCTVWTIVNGRPTFGLRLLVWESGLARWIHTARHCVYCSRWSDYGCFEVCRPGLWNIQPPIPFLLWAFSPGKKTQGREPEHLPLSSAQVKNKLSYTSISLFVCVAYIHYNFQALVLVKRNVSGINDFNGSLKT
jgi:hypothetical protein